MNAKVLTLVFAVVLCGCSEQALPPNTSLVVVSQENCEPCERLRPIIQRLAAEGYCVQEIHVEKTPQITVTPTLLFFTGDGVLIGRFEGFMPYEHIKSILDGQSMTWSKP